MNENFPDIFEKYLMDEGIQHQRMDSLDFRFPERNLDIVTCPIVFLDRNRKCTGNLPLSRERQEGRNVIYLFEDFWRRNRKNAEERILTHLGRFRSIFARNCEALRVTAADSREFLAANHSYGSASARHHYALFHKGSMVAAASFSSPRRIPREIEGKTVLCSSYEWVRYASLPSTRIQGGMGKLLTAFINDIRPDDIMTYADLEWSCGNAYSALGFRHIGNTDPIEFIIDRNWNRIPAKKFGDRTPPEGSCRIMNLGSAKYLWIAPRLTTAAKGGSLLNSSSNL